MELDQLVRAAATGDERAWRRLAGRLSPGLRSWFESNYARFESLDLVQDTLMVIWEKLPDFELRSEAALLAWAHKIAQFVALAAVRQSQRRTKLTRALAQIDQPPSPSLSSRFARAERRELVRREADKLPESYRRAVHNMLDGGDAQDLAELTGIKRESARGVESRACSKLRERLRPSTPQS